MTIVRIGIRGREGEQVTRVVAGQVRHRAQDALLPQQLVRERGDVAHVDAGADDDAARRAGPQRRGHERAGGREDQRGVERLRSRPVRVARPLGAQRQRQLPRAGVARAREGEHAPAFMHRDLADDVRGRTEAVQPEPHAVAGQPQRAVADQPAAQQRRRLEVRVPVGQREDEALVGDRVLGVAAVDVAPGEARVLAQVLAARAAVRARPVGPAEPRHADARAVLGRAHDLVPEDQGQVAGRDLAVADVQVGAADAARVDPDLDLPRAGLGLIHDGGAKRAARRVEQDRAHQRMSTVTICHGRNGTTIAPSRSSSASPSSSSRFARAARSNGAATRTSASPRPPCGS